LVGKVLALTQALRKIANNLPVTKGLTGRISGFVVFDDATFQVGDCAF